jgi:hypothetical protein
VPNGILDPRLQNEVRYRTGKQRGIEIDLYLKASPPLAPANHMQHKASGKTGNREG